MLIFDFRAIGNKLFEIRKRSGMTQLEVAIAAGLSERTYADIERGKINMRTETVLRICDALHITPDMIFTKESDSITMKQEELIAQLNACSPKERETALRILSVYLESLK